MRAPRLPGVGTDGGNPLVHGAQVLGSHSAGTRVANPMRTASKSARADSFQRPSHLAADFEPAVLRGHFVLSRRHASVPESWERDTLDGWILTTEPTLPVLALEGADGGRLGWVLGHPIDLDTSSVVAGSVRLEAPLDSPDAEAAVDGELNRYGGRWLALLLRPRPLAFGSGSLPLLFAPRLEAVASSPFLLTDGSRLPDDSRLAGVLRIYETGATFGFGATAVDGVDLAPPNHVLDLRSWETRRCWPRASLPELELEVVVERVASCFEATVAAAVSIGPAHVGLTAGGDTRMVTACSRELLDEVDFFTVPFRDDSGITDARWASRVASRFGLRHRVLPWVAPTDDDVRLWMYRTGCLTGEQRGRLAAPTYAQLGGEGVYVSCLNGNAARGDYAAIRGGRSESPSDADLVKFIGLPVDRELTGRLHAWQEQLPPVDVHTMLTLLQFEMCDAGWGAALACGYPDASHATFYPYCSRAVMDGLLRTSWDNRVADRVRRGVIESRWPELLELPFNRMTPIAVARRKSRRYAGYARAAIRKTRNSILGNGLQTA